MRDLKTLREDWADREQEAAKLPSDLSIPEKIRLFFTLYQTFSPQLKETEAIFGPERRAYLIELQQRLQRIAEWQQTHGK